MIIKAPNKINKEIFSSKLVFLAGSIEMGTAINWQDSLCERLESICDTYWTILNPRRDDWDSSWVQSYDNLEFNQQVTWEQTGIQLADYVVFIFDGKTKSPITLMELGLAIGLGKRCIVCCPKDFWRYGNIEIMCHLNGIPLVTEPEVFELSIIQFLYKT